MDREKVIKGLEMCIKDIDCTGCPYENDCFAPDDDPFGTIMMRDALALIKEQEDKIRQLRLALQILNGNGIKVDTEGR